MTDVDAIESFALLHMAPSQIDELRYARSGSTHDLILRWWLADRRGQPKTDAVLRWQKIVRRFSVSGKPKDEVPLRGLDSHRVAMMLRSVAADLPENLPRVSVMEDGDCVTLIRDEAAW